MGDITTVVNSISPDKRSYRVDASSAISMARQMLSDYFNRREWLPAGLIFITDAASTENKNLVVRIELIDLPHDVCPLRNVRIAYVYNMIDAHSG